jgi:phage tail-like protein
MNMIKQPSNPALGFYFQVSFDIPQFAKEPMPFMEVSGIEIEHTSEEVTEGGQNNFRHHLPNPPKYSPLILRRGLPVVKDVPLMKWIEETILADFSTPIKPKNITVELLDTQEKRDEVIVSWRFVNAYPVKWSVSNLHSMEDKVVIESMEFRYQYFERL